MRNMNVACFTFAVLFAGGAVGQDLRGYTSVLDDFAAPVFEAPETVPSEVYYGSNFDYGKPVQTVLPHGNHWQKGGCCDPRPNKAFGLWGGFCNKGWAHHSHCGCHSKSRGHRWVGCAPHCGAAQKAPAYKMPVSSHYIQKAPHHTQKSAKRFHLPKFDFGKLKACGCKTPVCKHGLFGLFHRKHGCKSCGGKHGCESCEGGKFSGKSWIEDGEVWSDETHVMDPAAPPVPEALPDSEARRLRAPNPLRLLPINLN